MWYAYFLECSCSVIFLFLLWRRVISRGPFRWSGYLLAAPCAGIVRDFPRVPLSVLPATPESLPLSDEPA